MFENPRRGRQEKNFTTNFPKILDLKSSSEQIFFRKLSLGAPDNSRIHDYIHPDDQTQLTFDTYFSPYYIFQFVSAFMAPFNKMLSARATASLLATVK